MVRNIEQMDRDLTIYPISWIVRNARCFKEICLSEQDKKFRNVKTLLLSVSDRDQRNKCQYCGRDIQMPYMEEHNRLCLHRNILDQASYVNEAEENMDTSSTFQSM